MLVANLIIDDGDISRGNRNNIFKENMKLIGIDHGTHKEFRSATVILFCEKFYPKDHEKYIENEKAEEKETKNLQNITRRPSRTIKASKDEKQDKQDNEVENTKDEEINDDDFDDGVVKVSKEIEIIEKGKRKTKIVTTKKTMKDGSIRVEKKTVEIR